VLADLARHPAQRRNDALVEMARRAGAVPENTRLPEPLFTVVIDLASLKRTCELWNGTVVTPGQLVRYLDHAWVERLVYDGPSRVIDVGVRRRFFTGATRVPEHAPARRAVRAAGPTACFRDERRAIEGARPGVLA
jgi:hypothetical protein